MMHALLRSSPSGMSPFAAGLPELRTSFWIFDTNTGTHQIHLPRGARISRLRLNQLLQPAVTTRSRSWECAWCMTGANNKHFHGPSPRYHRAGHYGVLHAVGGFSSDDGLHGMHWHLHLQLPNGDNWKAFNQRETACRPLHTKTSFPGNREKNRSKQIPKKKTIHHAPLQKSHGLCYLTILSDMELFWSCYLILAITGVPKARIPIPIHGGGKALRY